MRWKPMAEMTRTPTYRECVIRDYWCADHEVGCSHASPFEQDVRCCQPPGLLGWDGRKVMPNCQLPLWRPRAEALIEHDCHQHTIVEVEPQKAAVRHLVVAKANFHSAHPTEHLVTAF
ncbi:hypothetical protein [Devosia sp. A369]